MKVIGIVFEANPFHYGHQYLIKKVQSELNPDLIIGITSGYFTMRGELSILSKETKTQILLDQGIDLVLDLPIASTLNSADRFAENAVEILSKAGITDLAFGVEDENLELLQKAYTLENTEEFKERFKFNQKIYQSYKKAYEHSINELMSTTEASILSEPNMTLALAYYKTTKRIGNIECHLIKRIGESDSNTNLTEYPSGTAIRNAYYNKADITSFIPYNIDKLSNVDETNNNLSLLLKLLSTKSKDNFKDLVNIKEGIENYILSNIDLQMNFEENIQNLCNKSYTKSRIRRTILSMMLEIPTSIINEVIPIRVLGFNKKGATYLKNIKHNDLITNIKQSNNKYLKYDLDACKLYSIITNQDLIMDEYKFPIKKGLENE